MRSDLLPTYPQISLDFDLKVQRDTRWNSSLTVQRHGIRTKCLQRSRASRNCIANRQYSLYCSLMSPLHPCLEPVVLSSLMLLHRRHQCIICLVCQSVNSVNFHGFISKAFRCILSRSPSHRMYSHVLLAYNHCRPINCSAGKGFRVVADNSLCSPSFCTSLLFACALRGYGSKFFIHCLDPHEGFCEELLTARHTVRLW